MGGTACIIGPSSQIVGHAAIGVNFTYQEQKKSAKKKASKKAKKTSKAGSLSVDVQPTCITL